MNKRKQNNSQFTVDPTRVNGGKGNLLVPGGVLEAQRKSQGTLVSNNKFITANTSSLNNHTVSASPHKMGQQPSSHFKTSG